MVDWITVLFLCQLAGEALSAILHLPAPGPVVGMTLLFAFLMWNGGVPDELGKVADGLLSNLSLLFVPAGAGVMLHFRLLSGDWLPLSAALIASTLLTIAVTALIMSRLTRKPRLESKETRVD
jgi:holin-like protein